MIPDRQKNIASMYVEAVCREITHRKETTESILTAPVTGCIKTKNKMDNNNPYPKKRFNVNTQNRYREDFATLSATLSAHYSAAIKSGIDIEQIKAMKSEADLLAFIEDAKRKYLGAFDFLPVVEKNRIKANFDDIVRNYGQSILAVSSVYNMPHIVIEDDENGTPRVNVNKSLKAVNDLCFDTIDNDKLLRLRDGLVELIKSIEKFSDTVKAEKPDCDMLHGDVINASSGNAISIVQILTQVTTGHDSMIVDDFADFVFGGIVTKRVG